MNKCTAFQFIPANRIDSIKKYLDKIFRLNAFTVFDLEDAIMDVIYPQNTFFQKADARNKLQQFIVENSNLVKNRRICIRINEIGDGEFMNDLRFLNSIKDKLFWEAIILPKVKSQKEIKMYIKILSENEIQYRELIPTIETESGLDSIGDILRKNSSPNFKRIIFGHHDYNLQLDTWPFFEQNSKRFWKIVVTLIQTIENAGFQYINTPLL
jgi:citrate lyase beta subunit